MDIYATGTARVSRLGYPESMKKKNHPALRRAERGYYKSTNKGPMTAGIWFDRRCENFLSTASPPVLDVPTTVDCWDGANRIPVTRPPYLPDYIKHMRGFDRGDQLIALYGVGRKSGKSWKHIFYYLLECTIPNAYILEGFAHSRHSEKGHKKES